MSRSANAPHGGYTLVELLIVLAVLSVLAMLVAPLAELQVQRDRERELKRALWEIRDAIDAYHAAAQKGEIVLAAGSYGYPPSLGALVEGTTVAGSSAARRPFLRRVPRDPFADPALPAEATWALRSYVSTGPRPAPGADVYDVSSRAAGVGSNGIALKDW